MTLPLIRRNTTSFYIGGTIEKIGLCSFCYVPCLLFAGISTAPTAQADPGSDLGEQHLRVLGDIAPEVLQGRADQAPRESGDTALRVITENAEATVGTSAAQGATLKGPGGEVGLRLPFADQASDAEGAGPGTVSFDNNNGSFTVPVAKDDASVQITTIISEASAPTRYSYELAIPEGGRVEQLDTGLVIVRDKTDGFVAAVNSPWAKDAHGSPVPTHYEIDGRTLTQVVSHKLGMAYPIVADPWVGTFYFDSIDQDTWNGQPAIHIVPSGWSRALEASGNGAQVRDIGWIQLTQVWSEVTTKPTYEQQYKCHAEFALVPWLGGNTWDLEKARGNLSNWYIGAWQHHCNW